MGFTTAGCWRARTHVGFGCKRVLQGSRARLGSSLHPRAGDEWPSSSVLLPVPSSGTIPPALGALLKAWGYPLTWLICSLFIDEVLTVLQRGILCMQGIQLAAALCNRRAVQPLSVFLPPVRQWWIWWSESPPPPFRCFTHRVGSRIAPQGRQAGSSGSRTDRQTCPLVPDGGEKSPSRGQQHRATPGGTQDGQNAWWHCSQRVCAGH